MSCVRIEEEAMLKLFAVIGIVAVVAIAVVLIYSATLPNDFRVARSMTINAPPEKIFPLINDLKSFNQWNPFARRDPKMEIAYSGPPSGKGAGNAWDSTGRAGKGSLEITDILPPSSVMMRLDMEKPMEGHNTILFALQAKGDGTDVSWTMTGPYPYLNRVLGTVFNMDKMIGSEFEKGLAELKVIAEK
jgi:uncharacterized protein YndB with AHSA1/START domain